MENMEFDDNSDALKQARMRTATNPERSWMFRTVVKLSGGRIETKGAVNVTLFIFSLVIFLLAGLVHVISNPTPPLAAPEQQDILMFKADIPPHYHEKYVLEIRDLSDPFHISEVPDYILRDILSNKPQ